MRAIALFALLLAPAAEAAVPEPSSYDLGGRAVYYVPSDGNEGTWNPGVVARWRFSDRVAAEGLFSYQRHTFPETTAHAGVAQVSGLMYFGEGAWRGFGLVGGGYFATRVSGPNYRRNVGRFGPHAGIGTEYAMTPEWIIEADYRHVWLSDLDTRDSAGNIRRFKRGGEQISAGVTRRF
jgi:hypothetical protein